jgi:glucose/arabinose dehydrogenase
MRRLPTLVAAALTGALLFLSPAQPRVAADFADVTFSSEAFVTGANFPTNIEFAPDGRMFYNERCSPKPGGQPGHNGLVRVVEPDGDVLPTPFATIPDVGCSGDHGLIGLAFDPDYENNHYVYVSYMRRLDDPAVSTNDPYRAKGIIQRFTDVNNVGTAPLEIINNLPETDPVLNPLSYHGLNNIHFGPDGKLYISLGESNNKPAARNVASPLGKILRVNKEDGSAPPDNPFFNTAGADQRVFGMGFRNSFDFDWHPANNSLYMTENGFNQCDELNLIVPGGDYEWNTPFHPDTNAPLGPTCTSGVGTEAIYYFRFFEWQCEYCNNSTSAPTGIVGVHADEYPALGHSLLTCEFRTSVLRLLQLGGPNLDEVTAEPRVLSGPGTPSTDVCRLDIEMSPGGDIYYSNLDSIRRLIIDSDSDALEDKADNCPTWPNPAQSIPTEWTVPAGDHDCDGFTNATERYLGTNAARQCAATTTANDEATADGWPVDMNDDGLANTIDVGQFVFTLNETTAEAGSTRHDFNGNGIINSVDVGRYVFVLNEACSPMGP